ncbi:MAG TPA: DMT family transporter [Rhodocyclaceae bacterium]|nr:DMT family transporter [Rhodocyclaceae bacterium]
MPKFLASLHAGGKQHPLRGIAYYAVALLLFACLDATAKYLAMRYPVPLIAWVRYAVHWLLMTGLFAQSMGRDLVRTQRTGVVVLRAMCLVVITFCMTSALRRLPLAEATSMLFLAPLLVVLLARPVLQERIGAVRAAAVVAGFAGVLLIARPGGNLDTVGVLLALGAALSNTGYQLLTRILSSTENAVVMLYYSALVGSVCFGLLLPWFWHGPPLSTLDIGLFLSLGMLGGVGHFCFIQAFRDSPASMLAPVTYLQLVWAGLLGWLVFHQVPASLTLLGMLIIAVAGVVVAVHGHRRGA